MFDLFPDMGDESPQPGTAEGGSTPVGTPGMRDSLKPGARESIKSETGRLLGLMTKFLERGDDSKGDSINNNINAMAAGNGDDEVRSVFASCCCCCFCC